MKPLGRSIYPYMKPTQPTEPPKWSECAGIYSLIAPSGKVLGTVTPIKDPHANWFLHYRNSNGTMFPHGGYKGATEAMIACETFIGIRKAPTEMEAFEKEWRDILDRVLVLPKGDI